MADVIINAARVKELIKNDGKSMSGDYVQKLSDEAIETLVKKSIERATANGRQTVMAKDL